MLRGIWALLVFCIVTPVIAGSAFVSAVLRGREIDLRPAATWSRLMLRAVGARVTYHDLEHTSTAFPCVFAANHQSNVDIWAVIPPLPVETKFVVKSSLYRIPFLAMAMRRAGYISIDRGDRRKAIESLRRAAARIREGLPVIVFPEGTRSRDGRLGPLKKGSFHLAIQAGVPIVPVAISGSWRVLEPGAFVARPGPVEVRFLPPIDVTPFRPDGQEELRRLVHDRLAEALRDPTSPPSASTASTA
jgi:1-acyl-sn-glycerol-3-phosphate acyltransferase